MSDPLVDPWAEYDAAGFAGASLPEKLALRLAFYGRCSTEDAQDPETSFQWQLRAAKNLLAAMRPEAEIVATYFDIGESRSLPWKRRTQAQRLLLDMDIAGREFDGIIVGEGQRCWYGSQFNDVAPIVEHRGVSLLVPELGGEYDPKNSTHYMLMTLTGGMSRGERQRVQERVRLGMAAQVEVQGRFQGGRPPYGYVAVGYADHPNPRKAAEGFKIKRLELDPIAAPVVQRIFREHLDGKSQRRIAADLNRDGVLCPSAHDRRRNPHRAGDGWQARTIATILDNGRYTGFEFWGKFRKTETLLNPDDPTFGNKTRLTRSTEPLVRSRTRAHDAIIDVATFTRSQSLTKTKTAGGRRTLAGADKHRDTTASYALRGMVRCALCGRKMGVERYNEKNDDPKRPRFVRYRCRARDVVESTETLGAHPRNVRIGQDVLLDILSEELVRFFDPANIEDTARDLTNAASVPNIEDARARQTREKKAEAETRLSRLYDSIEAGVDPAMIAQRLTSLQREVTALTDEMALLGPAKVVAPQYRIAEALGDVGEILGDVFRDPADPAELASFFESIDLTLSYNAHERTVTADWRLGVPSWPSQGETPLAHSEEGGPADRVRGGTYSARPPEVTSIRLGFERSIS